MNSITQNMKFRQSLMKYSEKYGVSRASRKYNKSRSYIYFWKSRWDGSVESLAERSKRPHHHPNEHTEEEIAMIRRYRRRNPELEITELWRRLKQKGYTRRLESLYRVIKDWSAAEEVGKIAYFLSLRYTADFAAVKCLVWNGKT